MGDHGLSPSPPRLHLRDSLRTSVSSALLILAYVVPLHIVADLLLYFDALRPMTVLFAPLTTAFDLPAEAAMALASGVLLNIYAGIAFAAPLSLTPYQWTILGVFLGVCHSMIVECAIMGSLQKTENPCCRAWSARPRATAPAPPDQSPA